MFAFNKSNNLYINLAVTEESEPVDPFFTDNFSNFKKAKHLSSPYPYLFSTNNNGIKKKKKKKKKKKEMKWNNLNNIFNNIYLFIYL